MADFRAKSTQTLAGLKKVLDLNEQGPPGLSINLDEHLATNEIKNLIFTRRESDAIDEVTYELMRNHGFEHLQFDLRKRVIELSCKYAINRDVHLFEQFVSQNFKIPERLRVYIPIEGLEATEVVKLQSITLRKWPISGMNLDDNGYFEGIRTVAEVTVSGTDPMAMRDRALGLINYELKLLRVGLREHKQIPDQQLRFRCGRGWVIEKKTLGWSEHKDTGYSLGINKNLLKTASEQPLFSVPYSSTNKINQRMRLAIEWLDQSRLATDPLMKLLYDMFALEAILGDKSEVKKARGIAFRRALLSDITHGHYPDPQTIFWLYDQIRSYAVHGGEAREFDEKHGESLSWTVRQAINEYLAIVNREGFIKPQQMLDYLRRHPKYDELLDWLITLDPSWAEIREPPD